MGNGRYLLLAALAAALALVRYPDWVVYNASASVPQGLYVRVSEQPVRGSLVTVRARDVAFRYAVWRNFVGPRDRFIKRVTAMEGDRVCARGRGVIVGPVHVQRRDSDHNGHELPSWDGCHLLQAGEFFLLGDTQDSFDSRYFGAVKQSQIEGVWRSF